MTSFMVDFEANGFVIVDAQDYEEAEYYAKEYVQDNLPELNNVNVTGVKQH